MYGLLDCNNFYASCERVFNPALEGKPIVVLSNNDGCVIARSNEAKQLGIKMGVPAFQIRTLLQRHNIHVYSSNYTLYGDLSARVMETVSTLVSDVEVYSIDEAFLSLDGYERTRPDLSAYGQQIRQTVRQWTGIPTSLGIDPTKTLAKAANRICKKDCTQVLTLCDDADIGIALKYFPLEDIWGIGRQYLKLLATHGIRTAGQLAAMNDAWVKKNMTIEGLRMVYELRGIPCHRIETEAGDKKTMGCSRSFGKHTGDYDTVWEALATFVARLGVKLRSQQSAASLLTVFILTNRHRTDLPQYSKYVTLTLPVATHQTPLLLETAQRALKLIWKPGYQFKKVGAVVGGLVPYQALQTDLFTSPPDPRLSQLLSAVDALNASHGRGTVRFGAEGYARQWAARTENKSPNFTTRWKELPVAWAK